MEGAMKKEECSDEGMKMAEWMEVGRQRANVHDRSPFYTARYICSIWVIGHFLRKHFWAEITILSRQSNTTNELELKKQQRDQSETF